MSRKVSLLLDSGAFSVWRRGATIDLREYIDYISRNRDHIHKAVNLDVIPGRPGIHPSPSQTEDAAKQGWKNYVAMRKAGIDAMPVFHLGERLYWLEKMVGEGVEWIGVGARVDRSRTAKVLTPLFDTFFHDLFRLCEGRSLVKVHGFGVTEPGLQLRYPWYSFDSTYWFTRGVNGLIIIPKPRRDAPNLPDFSARPIVIAISEVRGELSGAVKAGRHYDSLGPESKAWADSWIQRRGFTVEELRQRHIRAGLNALFFMGVELEAGRRSVFSAGGGLVGEAVEAKRPWSRPIHYFTTDTLEHFNAALNRVGGRNRLLSYALIRDKRVFDLPYFVEHGIPRPKAEAPKPKPLPRKVLRGG